MHLCALRGVGRGPDTPCTDVLKVAAGNRKPVSSLKVKPREIVTKEGAGRCVPEQAAGTFLAVSPCRLARHSKDTDDAHATGQRALLTMLGLFVAGWERRNFEGNPRPVDISQLVTDDPHLSWIAGVS